MCVLIIREWVCVLLFHVGLYACVEPFSGSLWIAVDHRRRVRTHLRPSRRDALSNDTLRDPGRLRRNLRRCAANRLEVSFTFIYLYGGICVIMWKLLNIGGQSCNNWEVHLIVC